MSSRWADIMDEQDKEDATDVSVHPKPVDTRRPSIRPKDDSECVRPPKDDSVVSKSV